MEEGLTFINSQIIHGPIGLETVDGIPWVISQFLYPGQHLHSLITEQALTLIKMDHWFHQPRAHTN